MLSRERLVMIFLLSVVAVMVTTDLFTDSREGVQVWHLVAEGGTGFISLVGVFYLIQEAFSLRHRLRDSQDENQQLKIEAQQWKNEAQKFIEGLSQSIDSQLNRWNLSQAEKEVALLLLKGLSLKEIAEVRSTSEKTARVQSTAIYTKSGLAGRSELAAFFLEDLLQPQSPDPLNI